MVGKLQKNKLKYLNHSEEINEIITAVPPAFLRWGITLFFCIFLMILSLASYIHYPDIINASVVIKSTGANGRETFFGRMTISQTGIGNVHLGQDVLIKLKAYPFEQFGILKGQIKEISKSANEEGEFIAEVEINRSRLEMKKNIHLKSGMLALGEIVIQDATILDRIKKDVYENINGKYQ